MMPFAVLRLRNGAPGDEFVGPLDDYRSGLWGAWSINRLFGSWTGQALTARNSTSGAITDIGFDESGEFDSAALSAALSGANGTCSDWANQEGTSARGFSQASASAQPLIATAGTFAGKLAFDGASDYMQSGANSGAATSFTVFVRGLLRSTGTQILLEHSGNYNSTNGALVYYDSGYLSLGLHDTTPGGYSRSDFTGDYPNNNVQCWRFDRTQGTSAAMTRLFIDGVAETRDANGDAGTLPDGSFDVTNWSLGSRVGGSVPASLDVHTLLIYEAALSDADIAAISAIIAALP